MSVVLARVASAVTLLLGFLFVPTSASADPEADSDPGYTPLANTFGLSVGADVRWFTHRSYDLFDEDDESIGVGITAFATVLRPLRDLDLAVYAGWAPQLEDERVFQSARAELEAHSFELGLQVRYALLPWLTPIVRLGGGATVAWMSLDTPGSEKLEGFDWGIGGALALGVEAHSIAGRMVRGTSVFRGLTLGGRIEAGILVSESLDVELAPAEPDDERAREDRLPVSEVDLGALSRVAPFVRISGVVRF